MTNEMIEKLAAAMDKTPEETEAMLNSNPKLKKLLSQMSEQDAQKLIAVLGDRESVARILATPQAKTLMEGLGKGNKQQ